MDLLYGRNVYGMELCDKETIECCKQSLMGQSGESSEDQNTKKNVGSGSSSWDFRGEQRLYQEQEENHSCYILAKDLASFCPCP